MLDLLIYKIGFAALFVSIWRQQAMFAAVLLCASFAINEIIFLHSSTWEGLERWSAQFAIKDAIIFLILFSRQKTPEIILAIIFAVSCLYHQWMLVEIQNQVLTFKHFRTEFMTVITALQLATVMILITGGGVNGGKRAKHSLFNSNSHRHHPFNFQTFKDSK